MRHDHLNQGFPSKAICTYSTRIPRYTGIRPHVLGLTCLRPPHGPHSCLFETTWCRRQKYSGTMLGWLTWTFSTFPSWETFLPFQNMPLPEVVKKAFLQIVGPAGRFFMSIVLATARSACQADRQKTIKHRGRPCFLGGEMTHIFSRTKNVSCCSGKC